MPRSVTVPARYDTATSAKWWRRESRPYLARISLTTSALGIALPFSFAGPKDESGRGEPSSREMCDCGDAIAGDEAEEPAQRGRSPDARYPPRR